MDYKIELENGEMIEKKGMDYSLVSICNGRFYGGGFCPAPDASIDDGVLDVPADEIQKREAYRAEGLYLLSFHKRYL